jgi:hypothetical protein
MGNSVQCPHPDCNREFGSEIGKNSHVGHAHPSLVGERGTCKTCGKDFKYKPSDDRSYCSKECYRQEQIQDYCTFRLELGDGYPVWWVGNYQAKVHSLVAVANGEDPEKVLGQIDTMLITLMGVSWIIDQKISKLLTGRSMVRSQGH